MKQQTNTPAPSTEDKGGKQQHTPGPWKLQGPKVQEHSGETYWAISPDPYKSKADPYSIVGFYYPHSVQSEGEMLANAKLIASAPALVVQKEELATALKDVLTEYEICLQQMAELLQMKYSENSLVISTKKVLTKHSN